jgi:hypothetical protein
VQPQTLAELTRRDQAERERPVVIQRGTGFNGSPQNGYVRVELVNAGLGPALRVRVSASYVDPDWQPEISTVTTAAIPPNEVETIDLYVRFPCSRQRFPYQRQLSRPLAAERVRGHHALGRRGVRPCRS